MVDPWGGSNQYIAIADPGSAGDGGAYSATTSAVLQLVLGDEVDVGGCTPLANIYTRSEDSSFSGFLIKAD